MPIETIQYHLDLAIKLRAHGRLDLAHIEELTAELMARGVSWACMNHLRGYWELMGVRST